MGGFIDKLRAQLDVAGKTVSDVYEREQGALVLDQVAGRAVHDADGELIVDAGHRIDADAVERAKASGRLGALVQSVAAGGIQDIRERVAAVHAATPDGAEASALDTVEDYAEARMQVGRIAVLDVTDVRGNVIIASGTRLTESHIRTARAAGLLDALVHSATRPQPAHDRQTHSAPQSSSADETCPSEGPVRRTLPILTPPKPADPGE